MPDQKKRPVGSEKDRDEERHDLAKVAKNAKDVLIKAQSTFPFVFFPDTIAVSRMKVAITRRAFFGVSEVISIQHDDILNVEVDAGPFFGSIKIYTRIYGSEPLLITFLSRKAAIEVKRIIEGLIIAHKQEIEYNDLSTDELLKLLRRLGSDAALL